MSRIEGGNQNNTFTGAVKKDGCSFCYDKPWPHLIESGRSNISSMPVGESDNWIIKPPASPEGMHFVLRPKNHTINHLQGNEAELGRLLYQVEKQFGELAIMKHGDVVEEGGSTLSVRHDHTHLFPNLSMHAIDYLRDVIDVNGMTFNWKELGINQFYNRLSFQRLSNLYEYIKQ